MRVGFFVTCLVDLVRPAVGFAAIKLLKGGGADVFVPPMQTCCGQPAYNSGDRADAIALARKVVDEFESCDYLVAPSGSCSSMIKTHYGELFRGDAAMEARALASGFALVRYTWIPRERNRDADRLANAAMDGMDISDIPDLSEKRSWSPPSTGSPLRRHSAIVSRRSANHGFLGNNEPCR